MGTWIVIFPANVLFSKSVLNSKIYLTAPIVSGNRAFWANVEKIPMQKNTIGKIIMNFKYNTFPNDEYLLQVWLHFSYISTGSFFRKPNSQERENSRKVVSNVQNETLYVLFNQLQWKPGELSWLHLFSNLQIRYYSCTVLSYNIKVNKFFFEV